MRNDMAPRRCNVGPYFFRRRGSNQLHQPLERGPHFPRCNMLIRLKYDTKIDRLTLRGKHGRR